jgi:hypothetical protein
MTKSIRGGLPVALAVLAAFAPPAAAAPVTVNVRVEGLSKTYFEGPVTSDGHTLTTATSSTPHACDGTNNGANPTPGPTPIAALDDAARLGAFAWDGEWFDSFQDYLLKHIANEVPDPATAYWALYVNYAGASVGGCQLRATQGDEVLFADVPFSTPTALRLQGPGAASTGQAVNVTVTDGATGQPQVGAGVGSATTGADGVASVGFADAGIYRLKAESPGLVRSNALVLCVDPPGADPCTSTDRTAPSLDVSLPGRRIASEHGRSRTVLVSWQADDAAGAGVSHYAVDVREVANGVRASRIAPGAWRPIVERTALTGVHFRGRSGHAYQFRITAVDRAANRASVETDPLLLPVDDRDRGLWRFSRGWSQVRDERAWGRTVVRAGDAGSTATFRFSGRAVSLIGRKLRAGGRLRVTVDGRPKLLRLAGRSPRRSVLWTSPTLRDGRHVLRIDTLGGGPVELDAVAPRP